MSPQREGALRVLKTTSGYRLVIGEEETVVEEVDRFLSALETRGLSPLTVRAYAFDSLVFLGLPPFLPLIELVRQTP